jgi:predicted DNA-binding protein with PD1-like motif
MFMKTMQSDGSVGIIVLGLGPDELLLESVQETIRKCNIRNGAVVSGIGTLKKCIMHYIVHTDVPPEDRVFTLECPLELLSLSGVIADGEPHLHGVVSHHEGPVQGGHIEPGCVVAYLAEITIIRFNDLPLKRHPDPVRHIKLLGEG